MKAYRHLIKHALAAGHTVSVYDGEIWEVKRSTKFKEIVDCVESVEEATLRIRNADGAVIGWAIVSAYGLEDDETVADFNCSDFMLSWEIAHEHTIAA